MSARGFGSVVWAGAVAGAALSFYMVSLRVASERAKLEDVESEIAMTQRDIRVLQTELGTRGRLAQLERWNAKFIQLSAPTADQFVDGGFQLATLAKPDERPAVEAPVILASAPVDAAQASPKLSSDSDAVATVAIAPPPASAPAAPKAPRDMMHVAGYSVPGRTAARPKPAIKGAPAISGQKDGVKTSVKAVTTKPAKTAAADPLMPLPVAKAAGKAPVKAATPKSSSVKPAARKPKDSEDD